MPQGRATVPGSGGAVRRRGPVAGAANVIRSFLARHHGLGVPTRGDERATAPDDAGHLTDHHVSDSGWSHSCDRELPFHHCESTLGGLTPGGPLLADWRRADWRLAGWGGRGRLGAARVTTTESADVPSHRGPNRAAVWPCSADGSTDGESP